MASILVTGASGFIGRHLVPRLRADGHHVLEVRRTSGDVAARATWMSLPAADTVVHLAGKSFVPHSWDDPAAFLGTNVLGTVEAMEYAREHGAHLVFLSSYLYGDAGQQPIAESRPLIATNPYALSKKLAEEACGFFADRFGVTITILRPFNIYGPGQADTFLVPTIVNQVRAGRDIHVRDLEPRRDYVYVLDVVDAIVRSVARASGFRVFNVGSGASHSVRELIRTIQEVWGTELPVHSDGVRRPDEIMETVADIGHAARGIGWTPRFTLRHGLEHLHGAP
jgi:nucleoside-diphosphate-sugar epimerase